ncbi:hypothetical protein [Streptomyces silaceus]|uniref:hypothetical protein n=1 Tax=Streptomyces silaceus TaxID=545123 RepID=UPI0006EB36FD|nr:hypothetical protein [Streptomyces silaceus]
MTARVYARTLRGLACVLMAWQVWLVWHTSTYDASTVRWSCYGDDGCGTDQFAGVAPFVGIASAVLLGFLCARYLQRATVGAVVALSALAAAVGWYDAVDAGRVGLRTVTDFHVVLPVGNLSVADWLTVLWAVAGAGFLATCWGAVVSVRRTAVLRRISGRYATAEATLEGWRAVGRSRGEVVVTFQDTTGVRRQVPAVVERFALGRPVLAVYDTARPGDPDRTRVAVPRKRLLRLS